MIARRRFLALLVAAPGAIAAVGSARLAHGIGGALALDRVAELLAAALTDADGAARIGAVYLAAAPGEADPAVLARRLAPEGEDPAAWWAAVDPGELLLTVRRRAHADFRGADVVALGGWQLARSEGRLAALAALTL